MGVASRVRFHRLPGLLGVTGTPVAALFSAFPPALGSLSDARLKGETVGSGVHSRQPPQAHLRRPSASGVFSPCEALSRDCCSRCLAAAGGQPPTGRSPGCHFTGVFLWADSSPV